MRCGAWTKPSAQACKVDGYRIDNGARALARMYATYPRAEPDLKVYVAYVLQRAAGERDEIVWYGEGATR